MTLKLITAPVAEPILLAEAKNHLRVEHSVDDALISSLIIAARTQCEHITGRALITQTWERVLDAFPEDSIELGKSPVSSVLSVKYLDLLGVERTVNSSDYEVDLVSEPSWVLPLASSTGWPDTLEASNAVRVRFTAGYGDTGASVPSGVKAWMLLMIGTLYKHRETTVTGVSLVELPNKFHDRLLDEFRVY